MRHSAGADGIGGPATPAPRRSDDDGGDGGDGDGDGDGVPDMPGSDVGGPSPGEGSPRDGFGEGSSGGLRLSFVDVATRPGTDDGLHLDEQEDDEVGSDWSWVEEWRLSDEPPAWGPGVAIAAFVMLVVAAAVFVLSVGLGDMPWLAVVANVVVAAGLAPALWLCRSLPVLRFLAAGAVVGVVVGWIAALMN